MGATLHRGAQASHRRGLSCCGAQAPDAKAQQLWPTGPAAPRHVGSSQTRAQTRVSCISRQTLNHCATREALQLEILKHKSILIAPSSPFNQQILIEVLPCTSRHCSRSGNTGVNKTDRACAILDLLIPLRMK